LNIYKHRSLKLNPRKKAVDCLKRTFREKKKKKKKTLFSKPHKHRNPWMDHEHKTDEKLLRFRLLQMRQNGLLQKLYRKNFPDNSVEAGQEFKSVSLGQVTPIVAILATGLMISILVLMYER
jgi:hypothetical protein